MRSRPCPGTTRVRRPAGGQATLNQPKGVSLPTEIGIQELLEAGVHFGHQTRRWNPKMRRFIFGERAGIHIIDLQKTERLLHDAQEFVGDLAGRGGTVLFVGTKKQARDTIKEAAAACGMPYIDQRWLGGLLTNFQTISKRIKRLHDLRDWTESGTMELLPVRERIGAMAERDKLETNLGGVADMQRPPDAMFVVDLKTEAIGVREAGAAEDPDHRTGGHQLRPRSGDLRDPRQRRRHPLLQARDPGRSPTSSSERAQSLPRRGGGRPPEREEQERREAEERALREAEEHERREAEERARREAEEAGFSPDEPAQPEPAATAPRERRTFDPDEDGRDARSPPRT